ncbi:MAG: coenzyme F420-0:L-glutamate ligase, partial [Chloroflexota bacterium]|nr:coenzyme F420-0:L-glutamate ligase [Anaerolineales bacterium]
MTLTLTALSGIPFIRYGDNLADLIVKALQENEVTLEENDVLVLAQKIVSKAEDRLVNLATIKPSQRAVDLAHETEKDPRIV